MNIFTNEKKADIPVDWMRNLSTDDRYVFWAKMNACEQYIHDFSQKLGLTFRPELTSSLVDSFYDARSNFVQVKVSALMMLHERHLRFMMAFACAFAERRIYSRFTWLRTEAGLIRECAMADRAAMNLMRYTEKEWIESVTAFLEFSPLNPGGLSDKDYLQQRMRAMQKICIEKSA